MTKKDIVSFYRRKEQLEEGRSDLYLEILKAARDVAASHFIINEKEVPDMIELIPNLKKSHIQLINKDTDKWYLVLEGPGRRFSERLVSEDLDQIADSDPGKRCLEVWDRGDELEIEKLMLQIGEVQERIDRRRDEWRKYKERK